MLITSQHACVCFQTETYALPGRHICPAATRHMSTFAAAVALGDNPTFRAGQHDSGLRRGSNKACVSMCSAPGPAAPWLHELLKMWAAAQIARLIRRGVHQTLSCVCC